MYVYVPVLLRNDRLEETLPLTTTAEGGTSSKASVEHCSSMIQSSSHGYFWVFVLVQQLVRVGLDACVRYVPSPDA